MVVSAGVWVQSPDVPKTCLCGNVYDHPRFPDGKLVRTSEIVGKRGGRVCTYSGSQYRLGAMDTIYDQLYPDARRRLMKRLPKLDATNA